MQREVLNQVVQNVGEHVDCFAIRGLPQNYIDAVTKDIGWLGLLRVFVNRRLSPLEELRRLSPILNAIGYTIVVAVEDVDRNGRNFDLSDLQALLARFREVPGLSFVLTISNEQQVDFARLCEFVEVIATLDEEQTLKLIHRVRAMCLDRFDDLLPDAIEPLTSHDTSRDRVASIFFGDFRYWQFALAKLISNPRALKMTLRRVNSAWEDLHGEVNIDLLIISSALRTAASAAFSFLVENSDRIRSAQSTRKSTYSLEQEREKPAQQLKADWDRIVEDQRIDLRNVSVLLIQLLSESRVFVEANTRATQKLQGLSGGRGPVYARRLFSEALLPSEVRDQSILRLMRDADDQKGLADLAKAMDGSKEASDAFENFLSAFKDFPLLSLLSEIYGVIRAREGRRYHRDDNPAFFAPWRMMDRYNLPPGFQDWLVAELKKCIPGYLKLLNDIYYFWLGTDKHKREERVQSREAILARSREQFTTLPVQEFVDSFDPTFPYTLFHLVFTSDYQTPADVPCSTVEDWRWLGPIMLAAISANMEEMMPQILILMGADELRGIERLRYSFDDARLVGFFGDQREQFLKAVAGGFPVHPELDAQGKQRVELAIEEARRILGETK